MKGSLDFILKYKILIAFFLSLILIILIIVLVAYFESSITNSSRIIGININIPLAYPNDTRYNSTSPVFTKTVKVSKNNIFQKNDIYQTMVLGDVGGTYDNEAYQYDTHIWIIYLNVVSLSSSTAKEFHILGYPGASQSIYLNVIRPPNNRSYSYTPWGTWAYPVKGINNIYMEDRQHVYSELYTVAIDDMDNYTDYGLSAGEFNSSIKYNSGGAQYNPWQYEDVTPGKLDCGYVTSYLFYLHPGDTVHCSLTSTLNWGLTYENKANMQFIITAPPDPNTMTDGKINAYRIGSYWYTNNIPIEVIS